MKITILGDGISAWLMCFSIFTFLQGIEVVIVSTISKEIDIHASSDVHLHAMLSVLGIDVDKLIQETEGSFKLGTQFQNFYDEKDDHTFHSVFGHNCLHADTCYSWLNRLSVDSKTTSSFDSTFFGNMAHIKNKTFSKKMKNSYGLNTHGLKLRNYLKDQCMSKFQFGYFESDIEDVEVSESGVHKLRLCNGSEISSDLYIDTTSVLLNKLNVPFKQSSELDTIIVADVPEEGMPSLVSTRIARGNGWIFKTPLYKTTEVGYCFSSKYTSEEEAVSILNECSSYRTLKFRLGKFEKSWVHNVVDICPLIDPLAFSQTTILCELINPLLRTLARGPTWNPIDVTVFNRTANQNIDYYTEITSMYYILSLRKEFPRIVPVVDCPAYTGSPLNILFDRFNFNSYNDDPNLCSVLYGMRYYPKDCMTTKIDAFNQDMETISDATMKVYAQMNKQKYEWEKISKDSPNYEVVLKEIHSKGS